MSCSIAENEYRAQVYNLPKNVANEVFTSYTTDSQALVAGFNFHSTCGWSNQRTGWPTYIIATKAYLKTAWSTQAFQIV